MKTQSILITSVTLLLLTAGCAANADQARTKADAVKVYASVPAHAKIVGTVSTTSFQGITLKQAEQGAVSTLKTKASDLGANGIVLSNFDEQPMEGVKANAQAVYVLP